MVITAAELLAELAARPDAAERERQSREHSERARARFFAAARPVLAALARVGVDVESLDDIGAHPKRGGAIAVLEEWALRSDYEPLRSEVVYKLGERWTGRAGVEALFRLFETVDAPDGVRWCAAAALERRVGEQDLDRVVRHARHDDGTSDRTLLVLALGRFTKQRARVIPVLLELLDQLDARAAALQALGRLHAIEHRHLIAPYVHDADSFVREKARNALRVIDRAEAKRLADEAAGS